jgi:hypothetical protein
MSILLINSNKKPELIEPLIWKQQKIIFGARLKVSGKNRKKHSNLTNRSS